MAGETRADWSWTQRHQGFYVVNRESRRAVAGPYASLSAAVAEKAERDARWPNSPDDLRVFEVKGRSTYIVEDPRVTS